MFMYSRRSIQARLDTLGTTLSKAQRKALVDRLNDQERDRLAAMWEVMILGGMVRWGVLEYERVLENGSQPDFDFSIDNHIVPVRLIGDVTTVSDRGLHEGNPIDAFQREVKKIAKRYKVDPDHIQVYVTGSHVGRYGDSKVRLAVPLGSAQRLFLRNRVEPFVRGVAKAKGHYPLSLTHTEGGVGTLTVSYDPRRRFSGGGHLSYTVAYSVRRNPLMNALRSKASKLKAAPQSAVRVIVVCDGGSRLLYHMNGGASPESYSAKQIAQEFLRQNSSIDVVVIVTVLSAYNGFETKLSTHCEIVISTSGVETNRLDRDGLRVVFDLFREVISTFPPPRCQSYRSAADLRREGIGRDMGGRFSMSDTMVKISSRALLRLLSGGMSAEEFLKIHPWPVNPFKMAADDGRLIDQVTIHDGGELDDDWIEFKFGSPDAASSPFR